MKPGVWGGLQVGSIGLGIVQVFTWHPKQIGCLEFFLLLYHSVFLSEKEAVWPSG